MNHWIVDRDGSGPSTAPSVNLVVLSFVNPLVLQTNVAVTAASSRDPLAGIPVGMTQEIVDYLTSHGVQVMLSIGGITYTTTGTPRSRRVANLGLKAAAVASALGVGIEIDYEENIDPSLARSSSSSAATARCSPSIPRTCRRAAPDHRRGRRRPLADRHRPQRPRRLAALTDNAGPGPGNRARLGQRDGPVPPARAASAIANWQEHVDGKPQYAPPIPPLAPARFTGGLYLAEGSQSGPSARLRHLAPVGHRQRTSGPSRRRAPGHAGMLGSCSGPPSGRRPEGSGRSRRTPARAGWASGRPRSRSRSRCPLRQQ